MTRSDILDMVDEGALDARDALDAALQYLSTDDVADLAVTNGWDDEETLDDEDAYYDPTDGYKAPEGWDNSIDEAEDDFYENDYKVNIPEDDGFESEEDVRAFYNKD